MRILLKYFGIACVAALASCGNSYNVSDSDKLVNVALRDSTIDQATYGEMINILEDGYSYMRSRIAKAAFETNPTAAVNDVIDFMGDSTLAAVHNNSRVLIKALRSAKLDERNAKRFDAIEKKYDLLNMSLSGDSTALSEIRKE